METPKTAPPLHARIIEGLNRVSTVLRADDWSRAKAAGINPTQLSILEILEGRLGGLTVKQLSLLLNVSQPTTTDSILALERKGLVEKRPDPADGRAVLICTTRAGLLAVHAASTPQGEVGQATAALADGAQEELLVLLVSLIRQLQENQAIPVQRMCVSCRHFRPYVHADAAQPHHCNFVDAAFGQQDLRIDCREHDIADPSTRSANWAKFAKDHHQNIAS